MSLSARASAALVSWAQPYCTRVGLPYLAQSLPVVFQSLSFWIALQMLSALVAPRIFPKTFKNLKPATRTAWHVHWVAFCHATIITPLAARQWYKVYMLGGMSGSHPLAINRVYGYDAEVANIYAIAQGYFIWDAVVSALYDGPAFVAHGVVAMTAFVFVFHPIFQYDGLGFLLWELSTPFLNIHWFLDKLGMTGSIWQLINAAFLLSTYVGARLVMGTYNSASWMRLVHFPAEPISPPIPTYMKAFYTIGNVVLNTLNFIWFRAMVRAVQKRFTATDSKGKDVDPKKYVRGEQKIDNVSIQGSGDEAFEKEAGIGNHSDREARWRKVAKKGQ